VTTCVAGVFKDAEWAVRGVQALLADGFEPAALTLLARDTPASAGLCVRFLGADGRRLEVPVLGAVIAAGPLVATLQGEDAALTDRGLAATMRRAGFQPHDGHIFETLVGRGGVLVAVSHEARAADALAKLHAYGGGNAAIGAWSGRV
jgi:hypothetical protein